MLGATETEFAKTSNIEITGVFAKPMSLVLVAREGYEGMLNSKLDVISGLTGSQKFIDLHKKTLKIQKTHRHLKIIS